MDFLHSSSRRAWLPAMLVVLLICGCGQKGPKIYPVKGKVVFADGSPAMFGDIEFQSADHSLNARGKIQRDGTFTVSTKSKDDGAVAGEHQVVIVQVVSNHFNLNVVHDHGDLVHEKYSHYATTELKVTVEESDNDLVIRVDKRAEQPPQNQHGGQHGGDNRE